MGTSPRPMVMALSMLRCAARPQKETEARGWAVRAGRGAPFGEPGGLMETRERAGDGALWRTV